MLTLSMCAQAEKKAKQREKEKERKRAAAEKKAKAAEGARAAAEAEVTTAAAEAAALAARSASFGLTPLLHGTQVLQWLCLHVLMMCFFLPSIPTHQARDADVSTRYKCMTPQIYKDWISVRPFLKQCVSARGFAPEKDLSSCQPLEPWSSHRTCTLSLEYLSYDAHLCQQEEANHPPTYFLYTRRAPNV